MHPHLFCPPNFSLSTLHTDWAQAWQGAGPSKGPSAVTITKEACAQTPTFKPDHRTKFKFTDYLPATKAPLTDPGYQAPTDHPIHSSGAFSPRRQHPKVESNWALDFTVSGSNSASLTNCLSGLLRAFSQTSLQS